MRRSLVASVVAGSLLASTMALADTVTKTDGTVIEGEILTEANDSVTIKCKLGEVKIPLAEVRKVEHTPHYDPDPDFEAARAATIKALETPRRYEILEVPAAEHAGLTRPEELE
jgi:hypothetical protein